jgi:hypothetical protein
MYREEWDEAKHGEFLELCGLLRRVGASVVVCSYPNRVYADALDGWRTFNHSVQSRQGPRDEQVWMSYPVPELLHDSRYVGANSRRREPRTKRRSRLVAKWKRAGKAERAALLEALDDAGLLDDVGFRRVSMPAFKNGDAAGTKGAASQS